MWILKWLITTLWIKWCHHKLSMLSLTSFARLLLLYGLEYAYDALQLLLFVALWNKRFNRCILLSGSAPIKTYLYLTLRFLLRLFGIRVIRWRWTRSFLFSAWTLPIISFWLCFVILKRYTRETSSFFVSLLMSNRRERCMTASLFLLWIANGRFFLFSSRREYPRRHLVLPIKIRHKAFQHHLVLLRPLNHKINILFNNVLSSDFRSLLILPSPGLAWCHPMPMHAWSPPAAFTRNTCLSQGFFWIVSRIWGF